MQTIIYNKVKGVEIVNTNKLKMIRSDRGMSISELARRSGLSRVTITDIEKGIRNPTVRTVDAICRVLNKDPKEIFFKYM